MTDAGRALFPGSRGHTYHSRITRDALKQEYRSTPSMPGMYSPDHSTLYLTTSDASAGLSVREVLASEQVESSEPYPGVLAVPCTASMLHQMTRCWSKELSASGLHTTKCRLALTDHEPTRAELMQTYSLDTLIAWVNGQWLRDVLESRRLVTYFQPIVSSGQPHQVFAYECLLRGFERDGEIISPYRLFNAARDTGLLHSLDQAARLIAIESFIANERGMNTCVFINMNPRSIADPTHSLHSTLQAVLSSGMALRLRARSGVLPWRSARRHWARPVPGLQSFAGRFDVRYRGSLQARRSRYLDSPNRFA